MPTCKYCGEDFDLTYVKRRIGKLYGSGEYANYFPENNVCDHCAIEEISPDYGTGEDDIENMGSGWDD